MLNRYASHHGDPFAQAYAATLLLALQKSAPFLAVLRTPMGRIPFAYRGKAKKEKLISVQHFDHPQWRLIGFLDIIKKRKLYVYSTKAKLICTGTEPEPPGDFVRAALGRLAPALSGDASIRCCKHLARSTVESGSSTKCTYLRIEWLSADVVIGICRQCAKTSNSHTYGELTKQIASPKLADDFEFAVKFKPLCKVTRTACKSCMFEEELKLPDEFIDDYTKGKISTDTALIERYMAYLQSEYQATGMKVFVYDNECFGLSLEQFISKLEPTREERLALRNVLSRVDEPVIHEAGGASKLLATYWEDYGVDAIYAVTNDKQLAEKLYASYDLTSTPAYQILKDAKLRADELNLVQALPKYRDLPEPIKFADTIARVYKTKGADDTLRAIEKHKTDDPNVRAVAFAFLRALKLAKGREWEYMSTEIEFAEYLERYARALLDASPREYHKALQNLLSATGSTAKITPLR
jgi:hypothetical protein